MANFSPTSIDICITRGDSPVIPVSVTDDSGAAIDIDTGVFTMTVDVSSEPSDNSNNLFQISGTITSAADGQVQFQPSTTDTDQTAGEYFYDIQMELNSSVRTILKGTFTIDQDITK